LWRQWEDIAAIWPRLQVKTGIYFLSYFHSKLIKKIIKSFFTQIQFFAQNKGISKCSFKVDEPPPPPPTFFHSFLKNKPYKKKKKKNNTPLFF